MKRILLLIDSASEYDRKLLKGFVKYQKKKGGWTISRMPSYMTWRMDAEKEALVIDWARRWKADAIVGRWVSDNLSALENLGIPVILQNHYAESGKLSYITGDYTGTGEIAARFLSAMNYSDYAFYGLEDTYWSQKRLDGFRGALEQTGGRLHTFFVEGADESLENERRLRRWLRKLPKPIGLFACDDLRALSITEACRLEGISIPDEVSVLGVDNDELVCEMSDPQISSISLDVEDGGYRTGEQLHRVFEGLARDFVIEIKPGEICKRASTIDHEIRDRHIRSMVKYIDEHFQQDVAMADLLKLVPMSRRSAEVKFKQEMGGVTIYRYIILKRIKYFAQQLVLTDKTISEAAASAGISDYNNFSRLFRKEMGCSPMEYRKQNR